MREGISCRVDFPAAVYERVGMLCRVYGIEHDAECSADNEDAVCEYVSRLAKVNDKVNDKLILIPRVYTNKPRTFKNC